MTTQQQLQQMQLVEQKLNQKINQQQAQASEAALSTYQQQYSNGNNKNNFQPYVQELQPRQVQQHSNGNSYNQLSQQQQTQIAYDQLWQDYQEFMNKRTKMQEVPSFQNIGADQRYINGIPIEIQAQYNAYRERFDLNSQLNIESETAKIEKSLSQVNENNFDDIMSAFCSSQNQNKSNGFQFDSGTRKAQQSQDFQDVSMQSIRQDYPNISKGLKGLNSRDILRPQDHHGTSNLQQQANIARKTKQNQGNIVNVMLKRNKRKFQEPQLNFRYELQQAQQQQQQFGQQDTIIPPQQGIKVSDVTFFNGNNFGQSSPPIPDDYFQYYDQPYKRRKHFSEELENVPSYLSVDTQKNEDNSAVNDLWVTYQDSQRIIP